MKKALFISILILSFSNIFGQVDSTTQNIKGPAVQARDWEYIFPLLQGELYEPLSDSLKARYHKAAPLVTDVIVLDSIERRELLGIHFMLRMESTQSFSYARFDAALRALNDPYINNQLSTLDAAFSTVNVNRRQQARKRLIGQRTTVIGN